MIIYPSLLRINYDKLRDLRKLVPTYEINIYVKYPVGVTFDVLDNIRTHYASFPSDSPDNLYEATDHCMKDIPYEYIFITRSNMFNAACYTKGIKYPYWEFIFT